MGSDEPAPTDRKETEMNKIDQLNDQIRAAKIAISEAEMAGLRGAEMLKIKAQLSSLKAQHQAARAA